MFFNERSVKREISCLQFAGSSAVVIKLFYCLVLCWTIYVGRWLLFQEAIAARAAAEKELLSPAAEECLPDVQADLAGSLTSLKEPPSEVNGEVEEQVVQGGCGYC